MIEREKTGEEVQGRVVPRPHSVPHFRRRRVWAMYFGMCFEIVDDEVFLGLRPEDGGM